MRSTTAWPGTSVCPTAPSGSSTPCGRWEAASGQSQLCGELFLSKQTVHSALKQLEQGGYLQLENVPNSRKNKQVRVTSQGEQLLTQVADPVFAMEERAFLRLSPQQRQALLELDEALLEALRRESSVILNSEQAT